jgi:uncharacterized membrane protein YgcG
MKTLFTTITLIFALAYSGLAQHAEIRDLRHELTPEERMQMQVAMAQRQTEQMKERLKLDKEQEKAINEINLKYAVLRAQIIDLARTQEDIDVRALMTELEEKLENEILPFLNPDQIDPYFELRKEQQERRQQMQQDRGGQRGGGGGQRGGGSGGGQRGGGGGDRQRGGGEQRQPQ